MKIDPKKKKILETIENELKFWKKFVDHQFDELDIKIILALREDGRMSDSELAKLLEVSTSTISRRRTALIEKGYLKIVGMLILQNVGLTYVDVFIELSKDAKSKDVEEFIAEVIILELIRSWGVRFSDSLRFILSLTVLAILVRASVN